MKYEKKIDAKRKKVEKRVRENVIDLSNAVEDGLTSRK